MRRFCQLLLGVCGIALAAGAVAARASDDASTAFVGLFGAVCARAAPSFETTLKQAAEAGWIDVMPDAHSDLGTAINKGFDEAAAAKAKGQLEDFKLKTFARQSPDGDRFLVVALTATADATTIDCQLYDFDATAPIAPEPISVLIGSPPAETHVDATGADYVWKLIAAFAGMRQAKLTYIPNGSPRVETNGFDGAALTFTAAVTD